MKYLILAFTFIANNLSCYAASRIEIYTGPPPEYLYRWTAQTKFSTENSFTQKYKRDGKLPLNSFGKNYYSKTYEIASDFPFLKSYEGLFFWSDPAAGKFGGGQSEDYGNALLRIKINLSEPIKVAKLISNNLERNAEGFWNPSIFQEAPDFQDVDLIFHVHAFVNETGEKIQFQEWIVLNPEKIAAIDVDSEESKNLIRKEVEWLRNPKFQYDGSQIHWVGYSLQSAWANDQKFRERYLIPTLSAYLSTGKELMDAVWDTTDMNKCSQLF